MDAMMPPYDKMMGMLRTVCLGKQISANPPALTQPSKDGVLPLCVDAAD